MLTRIINSIENYLNKYEKKSLLLFYCLKIFKSFQKLTYWCVTAERKRRIKIGKLFNVPIVIAPSFLILIFLFVSLWGISGLIIGFISLLIHEFSHVLHAKKFDVPTINVLLHAGGVAANMEIDEKNHFLVQPQAEWEIGIVGPLSNLVLSALGYATATGFLIAGIDPSIPATCGIINLLLGGFNMLPIVPLDGGRVFEGLIHQHVFITTKERLMFLEDVRQKIFNNFWGFGFIFIFHAPLSVPIFLYVFKARARELTDTKAFLQWQLNKEKIKANNDFRLLEHHISALWWKDLGLDEVPMSSIELKRAYKRAVLRAHPDQGGSTEGLLRVRRAYKIGKSKLEIIGV